MLPFHTIKNFLKYAHPELSEIVLELRNLVAPDATEDLRPGGLVYYFGDLGGPVSAGICGIALKPDHVRLYFTQGAFIPDPNGLLRGAGKAMRYLRLESYEAVPWENIRELIEEHANFDPRSYTII